MSVADIAFYCFAVVTVAAGLMVTVSRNPVHSVLWLILAFLGIVQIGFAFIFFSKGIKHIPALEANLIGTLEPVLNPIWVFLFYGERMGQFALFGGLVVLGGVILSAVGSARAVRADLKKV